MVRRLRAFDGVGFQMASLPRADTIERHTLRGAISRVQSSRMVVLPRCPCRRRPPPPAARHRREGYDGAAKHTTRKAALDSCLHPWSCSAGHVWLPHKMSPRPHLMQRPSRQYKTSKPCGARAGLSKQHAPCAAHPGPHVTPPLPGARKRPALGAAEQEGGMDCIHKREPALPLVGCDISRRIFRQRCV